jgi:HPt (histidine-containing phosphotransfer) domain-containing protein
MVSHSGASGDGACADSLRRADAACDQSAHAPCDAVDLPTLRGFEEAGVEGEPDIVVELIDIYLESAPRLVAAVREAAAAGDVASLSRAAHNLRGGSASLGAWRVAALCEEIEVSRPLSSHEAAALAARLEEEFELARLSFEAERRRRP